MDKKTYKALITVIEYLWDDEEKDFKTTEEPELKKHHIFNSLQQLTTHAQEISKDYPNVKLNI